MKILIVTYSAYPRVGGRSTYITALMKELRHQGHRVDLIAHAPGLCEIYHSSGQRVDKQVIRDQVAPQVTSFLNRFFPEATDWIRWREIERCTFQMAIQQFQLSDYDIIHAQDFLSARCLYRVKPSEIPLVVTYHNVKSREWYANEASKHPMEMDYVIREESASALTADAIIFPCHWLRHTFDEFQLPTSIAHVIAYGIQLTDFENWALSEHPGPPIIVCPARLVPIKGHCYLLDALQILRSRGYEYRCWIIGDGVLRNQLELLCKEKGLEQHVQFLGNRNDVPTLLMQSDIVVLPTLHDTLPFAVMEAQLAGRPVVASRVGGIPEMISSGKNGWLVAPANSETLADVLARWIDFPSERVKIGLAARKLATRRWSVNRMVSKTLKVYGQAKTHARNKPTPTTTSLPDIDLLEPLIRKWKGIHVPSNSNGNIGGRVTTPEGDKLRVGTIHLIDISWVTLQTTKLGEHGEFAFTQLPAGKYSLMIEVPGYPIKSLYVEVNTGQETRIDIEL